jgi:hypothetical protein
MAASGPGGEGPEDASPLNAHHMVTTAMPLFGNPSTPACVALCTSDDFISIARP